MNKKYNIHFSGLLAGILIILTMPVFVCVSIPLPAVAEEDPESIMPFESFAVIFERNIFNPNRRKRNEERPVEVVRRPQIDELTLVGTLVTDTGSYAFFDGTFSEAKSVLKAGDRIADCTIGNIDTTRILLAGNDHTFDLKVGMSLMREDRGKWEIAELSDRSRRMMARSDDQQSEEQKDSTGSTSEPEQENSSSNDILKQLMERRKQELQK